MYFICGSLVVLQFSVSCASAPAPEESYACPGDTLNYACTVGDEYQPAVSWRVSCHTSSPETLCDPDLDHTSTFAVRQNEGRNFTWCYSFSFTLNFVRSESNLSIAIPRNTAIKRLEISCEASCRYLHVPGSPSASENLTYFTDYTNITEVGVIVTLMWSSADGGVGGVNVEYTLLLTDSSHNSLTTHTTHTANWTISLQFSETYFVTLYSSTCDNTLISDNFTTNITIQELQFNCPPFFDFPAGMVMTPIVEGSVISYQCGEVETLVLCGDDGNWRPNPTTITCSDITTGTFSGTTSSDTERMRMLPTTKVNPTEEATVSLTTFIFTIVGMSAVSMVALIAGIMVGVVTGLACRSRHPNITENQVPSTSSVSAGVTPEYEEISLHEAKDIHLTDNAAYGCKSS